MRRQWWVTAIFVATTLLVGACGGGGNSPTQTGTTLSAPVPDALKQKGKLVAGVKCDNPPYGFIDAQGKTVGIEIDYFKRMAQYAFGDANAVELVCNSTAARIPSLLSNRVDILAGTLGVTIDRAKVIDFSDPFYTSFSLWLALKDKPFSDVAYLNGKTMTAITGDAGIAWLGKCLPTTHVLQFATTSQAVASVADGRSVGYFDDDTLLVGLAQQDPKFIVTGPLLKVLGYAWAFGVRKGDSQMLAWANAAIAQMQKEDFFWTTVAKWNPDPKVQEILKAGVRRPDFTPDYKSYQASYSATLSCQ